MVRINKEEIKGITDDRHKSSCAAIGDNAAHSEKEKGGVCQGDECPINWHDE